MSSWERMVSIVDNIFSQCATGDMVDPGSYGLTRIIRLRENHGSS